MVQGLAVARPLYDDVLRIARIAAKETAGHRPMEICGVTLGSPRASRVPLPFSRQHTQTSLL